MVANRAIISSSSEGILYSPDSGVTWNQSWSPRQKVVVGKVVE